MAIDKKDENSTNAANKKTPNAAERKAALKTEARAKSLKFTIIAWALIILVVLTTIPINLIAERLNIKIDMTPNKYYTLSETSKNVLSRLNEDVTIYFLSDIEAVENNSSETLLARLLYQYAENEHVTLVSFDPDKKPEMASSLDPEGVLSLQLGDVVVKGEKLVKRVAHSTLGYIDADGNRVFTCENYITGAFQYIINGEVPAIYYLTGHEELKLDEELTSFTAMLKANNYRINELNLKTADAVPDDAKIVISAGAKSDLSESEAEKLNAYLDKGGALSFLLSPCYNKADFTHIERLLKRYALSFKYDRVYENTAENHLSENPYTMICELVPDLDNGLTTFFVDNSATLYVPNTRSLVLLNSNNRSLTTETLFSTNNTTTSAYSEPYGGAAEGDIDSGSFRLALTAVDESRNNSKVVLFGSADFLTDDISAHAEMETINLLYFSAISWMYNSEVDLMIPSRSQTFDSIGIESEATGNTIIAILILVPVLVAAVGGVVWFRRRNK